MLVKALKRGYFELLSGCGIQARLSYVYQENMKINTSFRININYIQNSKKLYQNTSSPDIYSRTDRIWNSY